MMPQTEGKENQMFVPSKDEADQARATVSREDRFQKGKSLSKTIPWEIHVNWERKKDAQDPISLIQENDKGRLSFLLPIKYGRMATSAFAFLRGSAVVMAADLSTTPVSGIKTILCGDAHLSNFGIFASPERKLIFDVNDFDECYPGPWEWDLKRLAVSAVLAGKQNGFKIEDNRKLAKRVAKKYRKSITTLASMPTLDVWYSTVSAKSFVNMFSASKKELKIMKETLHKALTRTEEQTLGKLTEVQNAQRKFINSPPLTIRLSDLMQSNFLTNSEKAQVSREDLEKAWLEYINSLSPDRRKLLSRYQFVDTALRVVGVGSVGTRCFITVFEANSPDDAIILQQKEAGPSVLERYLPKGEFANHAERVVTGQRFMQSASDIFLGWSHGPIVTERQYYWRQLKDMKGSIEVSLLDKEGFEDYLEACSNCLAIAHARSGDAVEIAGYLDGGSPFDEAIADFSLAYADQTEKDYQELLRAIEDGHIAAQQSAK
jgi:uncharacterized protein (DUF2252 family)